MSLDLHQVVHTVPLYTTLAQTTLLFIGRPSATKRKSQDSVGTEGESVALTTDGLRHFNMLCQLVFESCCSATHSTSKRFCLVYTFPLRTQFIILDMLPNWNNQIAESEKWNRGHYSSQAPWIFCTSRITWTRNKFTSDQQIISYLGICKKVLQKCFGWWTFTFFLGHIHLPSPLR